MIDNAAATGAIFNVQEDAFRTNFNRREFAFAHSVTDDPLFEPQQLRDRTANGAGPA